MALRNTIRLSDSFSEGEVLQRTNQTEDDDEYEYDDEEETDEDDEEEETDDEEEEVLINRARVLGYT